MNKRQSMILLGVLLINVWSTVSLQAMLRPAKVVQAGGGSIYNTEKQLTKAGLLGESDGDESGYSSDDENSSHIVFSQTEQVEMAAQFVKKYAKGVAKYLHRQGVTFAFFDDILNAYRLLYDIQSSTSFAINADEASDETKSYIEGAVQAMLDNEYVKVAEQASGRQEVDKPAMVQQWLKAHTAALVNYFKKLNVAEVKTYSTIQNACAKLQLTLPDASGWGENTILDHINLALVHSGSGSAENDNQAMVMKIMNIDDATYNSLVKYLQNISASYLQKADIVKALVEIDANSKIKSNFNKLSTKQVNQLLVHMNNMLGKDINPVAAVNVLDLLQAVNANTKEMRNQKNMQQARQAAQALQKQQNDAQVVLQLVQTTAEHKKSMQKINARSVTQLVQVVNAHQNDIK